MTNKIESLQIIRAFAATLVVICHIWNDGWIPTKFTDLGNFGVDLFFVLSGFIMCLTVKLNVGSRISNARNFLNRRVVRIFPIYILCTIPLLLFNIKAEGIKGVFFYVGNLLLLPSFNNDATYALVLGPGWSLVYEMLFFYVFALFMLLTANKNRLLFAVGIFLCGLVALVNIFNWKGEIMRWVNFSYIIGDTMVLNFVLGIITYYIYTNYKEKVKFNFLISILILLLFSALAAYLNSFQSIPRFISFGLPSFIIVSFLTLTKNSSGNNVMLNKIVFIGDASYSIYLTHFYFAFFKPKVLLLNNHINMNFDVFLNVVDILLVAAAIISGCLFYVMVEKPIITFAAKSAIRKKVNTFIHSYK